MKEAYSDAFVKHAMKLFKFHNARIIFHPFISGRGFQDVRKAFIQSKEDDEELVQYYKKYVVGRRNIVDRAKSIAIAVNNRLSYSFDSDNWGRAEHWAKPIDVHRRKVDDCDGYSVLITYLLRLFGAAPWQVWTAAGWVKTPGGKEYHAFTLARRFV